MSPKVTLGDIPSPPGCTAAPASWLKQCAAVLLEEKLSGP